MALLDRLRPQPGWKHSDPAIRLTAVEALSPAEQVTLATIARDDEAPRVRRAAIVKLDDLDALQAAARADADDQVKQEALARLTAFALQGDDEARARRACAALSEERGLSAVARSAALPAVAAAALERLSERTAIAGVARQAEHDTVRLQALARLNDAGDLEAVATRSEHKDVGLAALERLAGASAAAGADTLERIAVRARNKVVSRRATAILKERAAVEADARAAADALAKRRTQLAEALDALAGARDKARIRSQQEHLGQQWRDLPAPPADLAERWERSMERASMQYDELSRQEAIEAEQRAARETAEAERRALIDAVATVTDEESTDRLASLRASWQALAPVEGLDTAALDREFARATSAIEARVAQRANLAAAQARLTELADEAATVADLPDFDAARPRWQALSKEWRELTGGAAVEGALQETHAAAVARWTAREQELRDAQARVASENEAQLQQLLDRAAALAATPDAPMKDLDHAVRDLRAAADKPGPLSPAGKDTLPARLKAAADELQPRLRELRDTDEWRRWANAGIQDELCKRMDALKEMTDLAEVARQLRDLRRQWKAVAAAPREGADTLWQRFKATADEVQARVDAHFSVVAAEHADNLAKKLALCDQAEALAQSTDWIATADTLKRLQNEWQALGAVPKDQAAEVARRFRTACDTFFTRRKTDLTHRKEEWSDNQKKKEQLCVRMEELAESTDWNNTFNEIKKLQADWKAVGPVRRNKSEALWKRFRGACDRFFERYGKRHEIDLHKRIEEREIVCRELEALAPRFSAPEPVTETAADAADAAGEAPVEATASTEPVAEGEAVAAADAPPAGEAAAASSGPVPQVDPSTVAAAVDDVWRRWRQLPGVPPEAFTPLRARFESALTTVLTSYPEQFRNTPFDLEGTRRRMQALCDEVEGVTRGNPAATQAGGSSVTALAMLLKESLAANTIGGRVNEDAKARAAFERVRRAQSAWRDLGPAIGADAHTLESRFHRACRRFYEQHPQFEQTARGPRPGGPGGPGGSGGHARGQGGHGGHGGHGGDRGDRGPRQPRPSQPPRN